MIIAALAQALGERSDSFSPLGFPSLLSQKEKAVAGAMVFPNLRRLFVSFRTEEEEREYSRRAFFNFIGFLGSCALFSLIAQKANESLH